MPGHNYTMSSIRDLVEDWEPTENPTVREVATTPVPESSAYEENPGWSARMPGDEGHPVGQGVPNPMPELGGPLTLSRALREGQIPFDKERQVRRYLDQFQRMAGESLFNPNKHRTIDLEPQEPRVYGGGATSLRTHR